MQAINWLAEGHWPLLGIGEVIGRRRVSWVGLQIIIDGILGIPLSLAAAVPGAALLFLARRR